MLLLDDQVNSVDFPYHSKVHWLSSSKNSLRQQIIKFYQEKNKSCEFLTDNFLRDAAFLCKIMVKQNELNLSLQGDCK